MSASFRFALSLALGLTALARCGGSATDSSSEADISASKIVVHGTITPQSFVYDTVTDKVPQVAWAFNGTAGDIVAFDIWPKPGKAANALVPTLKLLGPAVAGKRTVEAIGSPRGADAHHLAVDGLKIPRSGNYLVLVGEAATGQAGDFALRLWSSASHAPRPESAQLDLALRSSDQMKLLVGGHLAVGSRAARAWTDADVDQGIKIFVSAADSIVAFSDAEQLLVTLDAARTEGNASAAQIARAQSACAALVGTPADFRAASPREQAFAYFWLGVWSRSLFSVRDVPASSGGAALAKVSAQIDQLVASWAGAVEKPADRQVRELSMNGAVYGYVADWSAAQLDTDGEAIFLWLSTDYFDGAGNWLGQQSQGASEPEDD